MNAIKLINKLNLINLILILILSNVKCDYLSEVKLKLDLLNDYLQSNLIELNSLTSYLGELNLNNYFAFYSLDVEPSLEEKQLDICLANRTDVCWHIEDTNNAVDLDVHLKWFTNYNLNSIKLNSFNLNSFSLNTFKLNELDTIQNVNRAFAYFDRFDNQELKNILVSFNLFMPFVCSAFLFLLCIQNQHRRKIIELNQLFRKIECLSGLQQIKEDMKALANVIDDLKLDAKKNQELKMKLQQMLNNETKLKQQLDMNGNVLNVNSNHASHHSPIRNEQENNLTSNTFTEQINRINQQLKLNQLEQSKLKYMVCKTIESFDRILNKMKNNCELINNS